jgi:hypothetical protein
VEVPVAEQDANNVLSPLVFTTSAPEPRKKALGIEGRNIKRVSTAI